MAPEGETYSADRTPDPVASAHHLMSKRPGYSIVIMGVSGSGKSTVGELLSKSLSCPFIDADDFHTKENIEKMRIGVPLTHEDRLPWLASLRNELAKYTSKGEWIVLACSALQPDYRSILLTAGHSHHDQRSEEIATHEFLDANMKSGVSHSTGNAGKVVFAHLTGPVELFASRLEARHKEGKHFMPASLLKSQLDTLEVKAGDEDIISLDASLRPKEIVESITNDLLYREGIF